MTLMSQNQIMNEQRLHWQITFFFTLNIPLFLSVSLLDSLYNSNMVLLLIILFIVLIATLSYPYLLLTNPMHTESEPPYRPPPGPKKLPLIGNLHHIDFSTPHISFAKLAKIYGPILSLRFGSTPVVVVQSARIAKEILQTQDLNFCSRRPMAGSQKLSYNGSDIAFNGYNECFKELKKILVVHLLNSKRVQSFTPIREDEISRLLHKIAFLSSASKTVNLSDLIMRSSCSNMCRIAFGKRYDDEEGQRSKFHDLLSEVEALFITFFFSDYFPPLGFLDKLRGQSSRLWKTFEHMDAFYDEIINDHLDPNRPKSEQEDVIDVLLQLRKDRGFAFNLTLDHIKGLLMDIFVAGTDTNAAMVVWAMTELIKNPSAMTRVQEEIRSAVGKKGYISDEDVQDLEYFKAVVKETFRLHPPAPLMIPHKAIHKTRVEGYDILPKTMVYVSVWAIGRDPVSWENPESFTPERFLGSSVDLKGQDFELIPFGSGRRICPGLNLGLATTKATLANLLYSFDWDVPVGLDAKDIDTSTLPGLATSKKNPLCLVATKRIIVT